MKETNHDYQGCLVGNHFSSDCTGIFDNWDDFKENFAGFINDKKWDDTYHFVFRYDIYRKGKGIYLLELCIMLQRKGIYVHEYIYNIDQELLDGEISKWLSERQKYLNKLWMDTPRFR